MKLSNLLRWGGQPDGAAATAEAPEKSEKTSRSGSFWNIGRDKDPKASAPLEPQAAPVPLLDGLARLDWIADGEARHRSLVEFAGGRARMAAEHGPTFGNAVWATPQGGRPLPAKLVDRAEEGETIRIEVSLDCPETEVGGNGRVSLKQLSPDGAVRIRKVRLGASETPGRVVLSSAASVDLGALVLVETQDYGCLGVVRSSQPQGEIYAVEIEMVMQARPLQAVA